MKLTQLIETKERPYICVHADKGKHETHAVSSYDAAKNAAKHWGMKSTAGIDAHLAEGNYPEPRKMQVTQADKDNNTEAWKRFKAGDPRYEWKDMILSTKEGYNDDEWSDEEKKNLEYTVWVGGTEVNDYWLNYEDAKALVNKYRDEGYDDVQLDARIKESVNEDEEEVWFNYEDIGGNIIVNPKSTIEDQIAELLSREPYNISAMEFDPSKIEITTPDQTNQDADFAAIQNAEDEEEQHRRDVKHGLYGDEEWAESQTNEDIYDDGKLRLDPKTGKYDPEEVKQMQQQGAEMARQKANKDMRDKLNRDIDVSQKAHTITVEYDLELDTPKSRNPLLKKHYQLMKKFNVFISMPQWEEGPPDSGFGAWFADVRGSKENLKGWLKAWEYDYDERDYEDMGLAEVAKPDFLDLDKDGNKKEPMKKAGKTKKEVCSEDEEAIKARDDFIKMVSSRPKSSNKAIDTIKKIVADKQNQQVKFDDGKMKVDLYTASAISQIYDAVKPETQVKIDDMLRTKEGMLKMSNFAFSKFNEGYAPGQNPNSINTRIKPGWNKTTPAPTTPAPVNTPVKTPVKTPVTPVKTPGVGRGHGAGSKATQIQKGGGSAAGKASMAKKANLKTLGRAAKLGAVGAVIGGISKGAKKLGKGLGTGLDATGFGNPLSASKYSESKAEDIMKEAMKSVKF